MTLVFVRNTIPILFALCTLSLLYSCLQFTETVWLSYRNCILLFIHYITLYTYFTYFYAHDVVPYLFLLLCSGLLSLFLAVCLFLSPWKWFLLLCVSTLRAYWCCYHVNNSVPPKSFSFLSFFPLCCSHAVQLLLFFAVMVTLFYQYCDVSLSWVILPMIIM